MFNDLSRSACQAEPPRKATQPVFGVSSALEHFILEHRLR
jgi:hypothetical protein